MLLSCKIEPEVAVLFEFDSDQRMWQDTVRTVLAKECPPSLVRAVITDGVDAAGLWRIYTDLGWTELTAQTEGVELAIALEELGRATDPTPYLATMTQFAAFAPGFAQPGQSGSTVFDGVSARRDGDGWLLEGTAAHVLDGDRADWLAVVTPEGVFAVPGASVSEQVSAVRTPVFDPVLHIAEVSFAQLRVSESDRSPADPELARQLALTGMALTMVGACQRILDLTVEHVRTRRQFGVLIGSFQAVQHKVVDIYIAVERARALAYYAMIMISTDDPRRRVAAAMAKAAAGECQAVAFRNGYQLFGAMGYTWENDLQFALKRAKAGELLLGSAAEHRALIAKESHAAYL